MCVYCGMKAWGNRRVSQDQKRFSAIDASNLQSVHVDQPLELLSTMSQSLAADVIVENANVLTLDVKRRSEETIAVCGDKIFRVRKNCEFQPQRRPSTQIIDAGGRAIIIGSNFSRGYLTNAQEVSWDGVTSLKKALQILEEEANRTPAPQWVQVVDSWTPLQFKERRVPTLREISEVCGEVPCFVTNLFDCAFINHAGLRSLGWSRKTAAPSAGLVTRNKNGDPSGMLIPTKELRGLLAVFTAAPESAAQ